jgi:DNA-binding transcriptional regulator GbsR (MarR family)
VTLSEQQKAIIEKIGISHEMAGVQPAAARILGLMYVADNPELTFEEITETLKISKSATSNALNLLLNTGQIEYTTYLGDRKRYFRLKISNWKESFSKKVESMTNFHKLLEEVLQIRNKETVTFNKSLEELIDFISFVNQEFPILFERWQKTRQ